MAATAVMRAPSALPTSPTSERPGTPELPQVNSFIIFDWDDTLLSSTWLAQHGIRLDDPAEVPVSVRAELEKLQAAVVELLEHALTFGRVCIITNAEDGWVELSARRFLPAVVPMLAKVDVLSARSTFERECAFPTEWKVRAFDRELHAFFEGDKDDVVRNVISLGDSVHERHAVHTVAAKIPNSWAKSIKFVERPTPDQLTRQVTLMRTCFADVVNTTEPLDLMLTIQNLY